MNTPMEAFFRKGNKVIGTTSVTTDGSDFIRTRVHNPHFRDGECELLTIMMQTESRVLIGGSVVVAHTLEGHGNMDMLDLKTGERSSTPLKPGDRLHIPTDNVTFSYNNNGESAVVVGITCIGFNQANQPLAIDVVHALTKVLLG